MGENIFNSAVIGGVFVLLVACSTGSNNNSTSNGTAEENSVVYAVRNSTPVNTCPNGGISVDAGIDTNGNGVLDPSEITSTQYVCNGASGLNGTTGTNGTNGLTALVSTVTENPGTNCTYGGKKVNVGLDANVNGALDSTEITSSDYICNGANGANSSNGRNSLVSIIPEPAGTSCPNGGSKISSGLDMNGNGILDSGEVSSTSYVCNSPGSVVIQSITTDPAVVRPGQGTSLSVSANDGAGSTLTYTWSSAQGSFSSTTANPTLWTAPDAVGTYLVHVQVSNGESTVTGYAAILVSVSPAGPIVTSLSPSETRTGDTMTITGAGFGPAQGSSTITIGGAAATSIASWSDTQIKAVVPSGATTGSVIVTAGGTASSPGSITIPWSSGNLYLTDVSGNKINPGIVSDGAGGAIITWEDYRSGTADIYAQRVNSVGDPLWIADGVYISTAAENQLNPQTPQIVSDGAGGALIIWEDYRSGTNNDIYAQRVNSGGTPMWKANGVAIVTAANLLHTTREAQVVLDGSGGAIITWQDSRSGTNYDIYAQRVGRSGNLLWSATGVVISAPTGTSDQSFPRIASDGSGGATITWQDSRSGTNWDIYAQRVNSAGTVQWTANGIAISTATNGQYNSGNYPRVVSDGAGGAIITWVDSWLIYVQRVNSSGIPQWTAGGVDITQGAGGDNLQIVSDGAGGAIISWQDVRNATNFETYDIYAQRVNSAGAPLWTANGVAISTAAGDQQKSQIVSDGAGGAIITWEDYRSGNRDIYAERVNSSGTPQWVVDGVAIAIAADPQVSPQIVTDGSGGAIITWKDYRSDNPGIYAQRVNTSGGW